MKTLSVENTSLSELDNGYAICRGCGVKQREGKTYIGNKGVY